MGRIACFVGPDRFSNEGLRGLSESSFKLIITLFDFSLTPPGLEILSNVLDIVPERLERRNLFRNILEFNIKPLFLASSHPRLNLDTGRKLSKPAGGDAASQDMFQEQQWKREGQGCWNVLHWCVQNMSVGIFSISMSWAY